MTKIQLHKFVNTILILSGRRRRKVAELSQEEKEAIMMSDDFHKFFDRTTRLMERAMCEDHQSLFVDYTGKISRISERTIRVIRDHKKKSSSIRDPIYTIFNCNIST